MKKRFGIDIDGTITRPDTMVPYLNKAFNMELTYEEINTYDLNPFVDVSPSEFAAWFHDSEPMIYSESLLVDGARECLEKFEQYADLYFISARRKDLIDVTETWFSTNELRYHQIDLIGSHDKIAMAKKLKIDLFFEDKHDNAVTISEECQIPVILFNTPYNLGPVPEQVIRVNHWFEARRWVENWLKDTKMPE